MNTQNEYIAQLENANQFLQDKVEELEKRLDWQDKTKDLRHLAIEYHRMEQEIYKVDKTKLVDSFLSIDVNTILDMWKRGYRIGTTQRSSYTDTSFFGRKRYAAFMCGPFNENRIGFDKDNFFGIEISVRRSKFYPLMKDSCFIILDHNRTCPFSGAISESCHMLSPDKSKDILDLVKRIDICKKMMNGNVMGAFIKRDTFKFPWTDIAEFDIHEFAEYEC
jgi:hypothetical protein